MSLYGGIKFSIPGTGSPANEKGKSAVVEPQAKGVKAVAPPPSNVVPPTETAEAEAPKASSSKGSGVELSAALKFAPRIPKSKPIPATRPAGFVSSPTTTYSAAPTLFAQAPTPTTSTSTGIERSTKPDLGAEKTEETPLGPDGRPLAKAPAMTLAAAGQREWVDRDARAAASRYANDNRGKKRKKKKRKQQQIMPQFDPEEQYDPTRPNDLSEYQAYRKKLREERRRARAEEARRRAAGEGSEGSSYYTDSEEEVAPRRDAPRMFAPPRQYSPPPPPPSDQPPPPPPQASDPVQTGDDAYARRAAMSHAASGEDAYARRLAMSQATTGDDAYAGRAALAQPQTPISPFTPPAAASSASFIPPPIHLASAAPVAPNLSTTSGIPGLGSLAAASAPPPPPSAAVNAATTTNPTDPSDFARILEDRKRAAAAIAAKFAAPPSTSPFASSGPPPPVPADVDPNASFAEKMMKRWGHKDGSGLGKDGEGIKHALTAEHVLGTAKVGDPTQPTSKKQLAKQRAAAANMKSNGKRWVQAGTNRGKIVNANEEERLREEKGRIGEASRVVVLSGVVGGLDDVDEDMSEEIGEECSKYGIVERVVLHIAEGAVEDTSEALRIFVVFSGMAGAWRAVKELDGRLFGGRNIRARYFDETRFNANDRDAPLI